MNTDRHVRYVELTSEEMETFMDQQEQDAIDIHNSTARERKMVEDLREWKPETAAEMVDRAQRLKSAESFLKYSEEVAYFKSHDEDALTSKAAELRLEAETLAWEAPTFEEAGRQLMAARKRDEANAKTAEAVRIDRELGRRNSVRLLQERAEGEVDSTLRSRLAAEDEARIGALEANDTPEYREQKMLIESGIVDGHTYAEPDWVGKLEDARKQAEVPFEERKNYGEQRAKLLDEMRAQEVETYANRWVAQDTGADEVFDVLSGKRVPRTTMERVDVSGAENAPTETSSGNLLDPENQERIEARYQARLRAERAGGGDAEGGETVAASNAAGDGGEGGGSE